MNLSYKLMRIAQLLACLLVGKTVLITWLSYAA
jgi:hypothetical protein